MATITIDRKKYRSSKATATFLDKFMEAQVKESKEVTRVIKEKEVKTTVFNIIPWKLFKLAETNGFKFDGIRAQVEAEQVGAIGRARMILAGALKRKLAKGGDLVDIEGKVVEKTDEFKAYVASITPVAPAKPEAPSEEAAAA